MRLTLANKVAISVAGVIVLAVLSSVAALLSCRHVGELMEQAVYENLPSVRAAEELEIAVLEQRGFVSSYLLDGGNREWLAKLEEREGRFHEWLAQADETAHTDEEREILRELQAVYRQYDVKRDEVVNLYSGGEAASAAKLLVKDVNDLYGQAYELCEKFIAANQLFVDGKVADARARIRWVTFAVSVCVVLTIGLGALLLWLFFYGVVFPLRAMVADARGFSGEPPSEGQPLPTDELRAVGIYLRNLMSDVTDTRTTLSRSRGQLRDAEKLASVGKLAASVAHEIRNPLTAIKMWLFSIHKEVGGEEALDRKFGIVSDEIRRLENIVRSFLEFSRPPELRRSVECVVGLLDRALELTAPRFADRRIEISRREGPDLPRVAVDAQQFRQVLLNLLNNAAEATGEGGQIRVMAVAEAETDGRKMVVVRISDSGPGIPEPVARRIFEPFFSTKDDGTGLGLCIAAQIMARHEGRLVLESTNQQGTTFAIYIPEAGAHRT